MFRKLVARMMIGTRDYRVKNPTVPSYTPPQNRGGDGVLLVAFGYQKEREKKERKKNKR